MTTSYRQKLIGEINAIPDSLLPRFYRIMHTLRTELIQQAGTTSTRGSLKGIWKGSSIDESLLAEAKETLFPYQHIVATALCYDAALVTRDEKITKSRIVETIW